ncbi:MAG: sulfatase family protein [Actinomycetota bacterium]
MRRPAVAALTGSVLALALPEPAVVAGHGSAAPNILIFMTDDQRADMMGVMKKTQRWFVRQGTSYPFAYATTPLCCPSRASIFSGRYAHNTGVETNAEATRLDQRSTMQRYLQDAGYRTAIVGKYLNDWQGAPPFFHDWAIFLAQDAGYTGAGFNVNGASTRVKRYSTNFIGTRAVQLLRSYEQNDQDPWLLTVAPLAPHAPYQPEKRYRKTGVSKFRKNPAVGEDDRTDKPAWVQGKNNGLNKNRKIWTVQQRMLLSADNMIDRVMRELNALGEGQNTLAFFLSDNGFTLGEHGLRQKHSPYTASVQLPFMVRWPGHLAGGAVDPRVVGNIDIAPTVYDAAGITPDPEFPVDGRSILAPDVRDHMLLEYEHRQDRAVPTWASLRTPTYQYVEYYDETLQAVTFREYYDLVADPWQLTNLLADGDPNNDPPDDLLTRLSVELQGDTRCEGTEGPTGCP